MHIFKDIMNYLYYILSSYLQIILIIVFSKKKSILMVDIDRTIAVTPVKDEFFLEDMGLYKYYPDMVSLIKLWIEDENYFLVFSSIRPLKSFKLTKQWLKRIGFRINWNQLLLARTPMQKIKVINFFHKRGFKVKIVDDFTYNHKKNGDLVYYNKALNRINELGIVHFSLQEMKKYQIRIKKV